MILNCKHCTAPLMKYVSLESAGDAVFRAKFKCPHCKAPNIVEIRNSVVSVVILDGQRVQEDETTNIRTL